MKINNLFILFLLLPFAIVAQNTTFQEAKGPLREDGNDSYLAMYYITKGNEVMVVASNKKALLLDKYNWQTMELVSSGEDKVFSNTYCIFERLLSIKNRHYLLYSSFDKKKKKDKLLCKEIDFETCKFGPEQVLVEVDYEIPMNHTSRIDIDQKFIYGYVPGTVGNPFSTSYHRNRYRFEFSKDSLNILVQHITRNKSSKDSENFQEVGLYVFGEGMSKKWGGLVKMPYVETAQEILDYGVDSKGNGYVLIERDADPALELLVCNNGEMKIMPIKGTSKRIHTNQILEDKDGNLVFTGYFARKKDRLEVAGVYYFKVNEKGEVSDLTNLTIPAKLCQWYDPEDSDKAFGALELKKYFFQEDGSVILVGQVYTPSLSGQTQYPSICGNVLLAKISQTGSIKWMAKAPKEQALNGGYIYQKIDNSHYIIFADDIANEKISPDKRPKTHGFEKGNYLAAYKFEEEMGTMIRTTIVKNGTPNIPTAGAIYFVSERDYIFGFAPTPSPRVTWRKGRVED